MFESRKVCFRMKTLVVVHVYYPQLWPELAACVRNVDGERDLVVTYGDEAAVQGARRDFPEARFLKCENRGYDIWPFIAALQSSDLSAYDAIVKLHTKRDVVSDIIFDFNHAVYNGPAWRNFLLGFVRTPEAWRRTRRLLAKSGVGMVAERHVVMRRRDVPVSRTKESFDAAAEFLGLDPKRVRRSGQYVAGTMFAAKPAALRPLLGKELTAELFELPTGHMTETFAHVMERALGLSVTAAGQKIVAFNGSLRLRRAWYWLCKLVGK